MFRFFRLQHLAPSFLREVLSIVFAVVSLSILFIIGSYRYTLVEGRIRAKFSESILNLASATLATGFAFVLLVSASDSIISFLDVLAKEQGSSDVWSLLLAPLVMMAASMILYALLYVTGKIAEAMKFYNLAQTAREIRRRKMRERNKRVLAEKEAMKVELQQQ